MYKTVIFDLDGTLLNTLTDLTNASNAICMQNGWPTFSQKEIRQMVGNGILKLVERFSPPDERTPEKLEKTMNQFITYYDLHKMDETAPYPGIPEVLEALRAEGVKIAVFSNKADELCPIMVRHYFGDVFDAVRGKRIGVPAKPDPTGVFELLSELNATADESIYVGDSDVDVMTGHHAGLPVCGVTWGFRGREELQSAGAEFLADHALELKTLLLKK